MMRARRRSAVRPPRRRGYRGWRIAGWRRWSRSWRRLREEGSRASRLDRVRIASWLSIVAFRGGCVQRGDLGAAAGLRGGGGNREELEPQGAQRSTGATLPMGSAVPPRLKAKNGSFGSLLVQGRLAGRASFPAAVDPEPLVGIAADEVFDDLGEFRGIGHDIGLVVAGANQLHGGIEAQDIFSQLRIPHRKAGDYGGVGAQGNAG